MRIYNIFFTEEAENDLFQLHQYVSREDSPSKADTLLNRLGEACFNLKRFPARGHIPPELERIQVMTYREIAIAPYRIIYQIFEKEVYIHAILDGRRNMSELLERRLLTIDY